MRQHRARRHRRQQVADRIAALQDPGEHAAPFPRRVLQRQRRAHAPLPSHADPEQRPQDQKLRERGGEAGEQLDQGEIDDVRHQRDAPAVAVGQHAEDDRADGPQRQRRRQRGDNPRLRHAELRGQRVEQEDDDEEIEGVERPPEEPGGDRVARVGLHERAIVAEVRATIRAPNDRTVATREPHILSPAGRADVPDVGAQERHAHAHERRERGHRLLRQGLRHLRRIESGDAPPQRRPPPQETHHPRAARCHRRTDARRGRPLRADRRAAGNAHRRAASRLPQSAGLRDHLRLLRLAGRRLRVHRRHLRSLPTPSRSPSICPT